MTVRLIQVLAISLATLASAHTPESQSSLRSTVHPALPRKASDLWLVPSSSDRSARTNAANDRLAAAVRQYQDGEYANALAALRGLRSNQAIADYVEYYKGLAALRLNDHEQARKILDSLTDGKPEGALALAAALAHGEAEEMSGNHRAAAAIYQRLAADTRLVNEEVLSRLGRAALAAGDRKTAAEAYLRVYYEFALTDAATAAASHIEALGDQIVRTGYKADLGRAAMLFGARRYAEARSGFQDVQKEASGDDRELAELRIAESDFFLRRYAAARDGLTPHLDRASRKAEARFFYLSALRELGRHDEFVSRTRALVAEFPESSWAEEALNNLGTHYILENDDRAAADTFAELFERFPNGARAERAAWKAGWWSYRTKDYARTIELFERAAEAFPRSDYRPSYLYWAARAHARLGAGERAQARFQLVHDDYGNSYYGRLASRRIARGSGALTADRPVAASAQAPPSSPPPTADRIRLLLANGMYDDAVAELEYARRQWGTSPAIEATMAWAYHKKGELRRAITLMRRAYPQSLTAEGHELPVEIRQVIFPLVYWDLIRKHATARGLDPYIVAALIGQESTFDPRARSVANAWGLMQIVPATGRRLARSLRIRSFRTSSLTVPQTNIQLGTLYFSQLAKRFGGVHFALASYNAGENRVVRWKAERGDLDQDEFIDDIPFPETQNYVKRILGTAEDYRRLYSKDGGRPQSPVEKK
ncbi:MAG: transglycosylase SLT domain-containing protein [Vicinamibacterales bacterium]